MQVTNSCSRITAWVVCFCADFLKGRLTLDQSICMCMFPEEKMVLGFTGD